MKSIIRKILKEQRESKSHLEKLYSSSLKNVAYKLIDTYSNIEEGWDNDIESLITYLSSRLGLNYSDSSFFIFSYLINENDDPTDHRSLSDWLYKVTSGEEIEYLKVSGYYDDYMDYKKFSDLDFSEEGKIYLNVDGYMDFAEWFDSEDLVSRVFDEDWFDMFDGWGEDFSHICDHLNDDTISYIVDVIASENDYLVELGHREEFEEIISEGGVLKLTPSNVEYIKNNIDGYILNVLITDSNLSGGDIEHHIRSSWNNGYNLAAEDELFEQYKGEIEDFMGSKIEVTDDGLRIDVTNKVVKLTERYFSESHENPIDEHSTFLDMISGLFNYYITKLDSGNLDYYYPDHRKVEEHFNYMVKENY